MSSRKVIATVIRASASDGVCAKSTEGWTYYLQPCSLAAGTPVWLELDGNEIIAFRPFSKDEQAAAVEQWFGRRHGWRSVRIEPAFMDEERQWQAVIEDRLDDGDFGRRATITRFRGLGNTIDLALFEAVSVAQEAGCS